MANIKAGTAVARGLSLHIGLNSVSEAAYSGWSGLPVACEFDATDMAAIAKTRGMKSTVLLSKKATRANVLAKLRNAAKSLKSGDLLVIPGNDDKFHTRIRAGLPTSQSPNLFTLVPAGNFLTQAPFTV